jgi:TM2 domain-containing membrane protein YozV
MKSLKQLSLIALVITLVLNSCSIEKRVYMSGYHITWNKTRVNHDKQELANNYNAKDKKQNKIATLSQTENDSYKAQNSMEAINDNYIASLNNSAIIAPREIISFNKNENNFTAKTNQHSGESIAVSKKISKAKKKIEKNNSADTEGKSQLVALLLCIFIGVLGIHRFYLGYTGIGILMLLTGGVCGILALIDLIRIITGDLKPIDGDYSEKL